MGHNKCGYVVLLLQAVIGRQKKCFNTAFLCNSRALNLRRIKSTFFALSTGKVSYNRQSQFFFFFLRSDYNIGFNRSAKTVSFAFASLINFSEQSRNY